MRNIIKHRKLITDPWCDVDENPAATAIIIPLSQWQQDRTRFLALQPNTRLGVRIGPADKVETLAADIPHLNLVAIEFGGIAEGRGYSQAYLLRQRYGFKGELRAVGNIQKDQLFYMARCGFDAFELPAGADVNLALAAFNDFTVAYQTAVDTEMQLTHRNYKN